MSLVDVLYADTYFTTRLGASTYWTSGAAKTAALATAETQLGAQYSLPTRDADEVTKKAICEQALFLLRDPDADARADIRAQGVASNKMDGEAYTEQAMVFPVAPVAQMLLAGRECRPLAFIGGAVPELIESREQSSS